MINKYVAREIIGMIVEVSIILASGWFYPNVDKVFGFVSGYVCK